MNHRELARRSPRSLLADRRGLSTMEYTVILVIILFGGLAVWNKLGKAMVTQVSQGQQTVGTTLGSFQHGVGTVNEPGGSPNTGNQPGAPAGMVPGPCSTCSPQPSPQPPAAAPAAEPPQGGLKKQHSI